MRGRMTGVNMVFFMGGPQLGELEAGLVANWFGADRVGGHRRTRLSRRDDWVAARTPALRRVSARGSTDPIIARRRSSQLPRDKPASSGASVTRIATTLRSVSTAVIIPRCGQTERRRPLRSLGRAEEADASASGDKAPLTRTLDKKEVEDEVAETLGKLGHDATLHVLDGSIKSLHALARMECDLIFNLAESFGGNDTADYCIAAYLELLDKRFTGSGSHGLLFGQDKAVAKKILEFHGIHTPVFARSFRGRLDFSHDLEFPVIVKPAREDGSIGIEFNAVVYVHPRADGADRLAARQLRFAGADRGVRRRPRDVRRGHRQRQSRRRCRSSSWICRSCRKGTPRIAGAEVKWGKGTRAYRDTKSAIAEDLPEETVTLLQQTAIAVFQALELRDYARIDMRLRPDGRVAVIEANPNPWLASKAEFAMAAPQVRPQLHAAHRRDRRPGDGAIRVIAPAVSRLSRLQPIEILRAELADPGSRIRLSPDLPQIQRDLVAAGAR